MKTKVFGIRLKESFTNYLLQDKEIDKQELIEQYIYDNAGISFHEKKIEEGKLMISQAERKISEIKKEVKELKKKLSIEDIGFIKLRAENGASVSDNYFHFNKKKGWNYSLPAYIELNKEVKNV